MQFLYTKILYINVRHKQQNAKALENKF